MITETTLVQVLAGLAILIGVTVVWLARWMRARAERRRAAFAGFLAELGGTVEGPNGEVGRLVVGGRPTALKSYDNVGSREAVELSVEMTIRDAAFHLDLRPRSALVMPGSLRIGDEGFEAAWYIASVSDHERVARLLDADTRARLMAIVEWRRPVVLRVHKGLLLVRTPLSIGHGHGSERARHVLETMRLMADAIERDLT